MIIGVVAAIVIPPLNNNIQDAQFKVSYKKAYSDMSQAFAQAIQEQSLTPRSERNDIVATESEWAVLKGAFKVTKTCESNNLYKCWVKADKVCTGSCSRNSPGEGGEPGLERKGFVDASGRTWSQFNSSQNIYLVDTNGSKPPNRFGKDRWVFVLRNADNTWTESGLPAKVSHIRNDETTKSDWCTYPPCYYYSWLYK